LEVLKLASEAFEDISDLLFGFSLLIIAGSVIELKLTDEFLGM
jgi:hypothetical protein